MEDISDGFPSMKLVSLHRHWLYADSVRDKLDRVLESERPIPSLNTETIEGLGEIWSCISVISVWYALLYVVVEGYLELGETDVGIDSLIADTEQVARLKRFRNAVFHYQPEPINQKLTAFLQPQGSEFWIHALNGAFQKFFESRLKVKELLERKGLAHLLDKGAAT